MEERRKKELPEIFGEFGEMRQKSFLAAYEMKQKNIPFVGTFCTYFPQEIAMAMGAIGLNTNIVSLVKKGPRMKPFPMRKRTSPATCAR